jgi:hypothetical protein
MRSLWRLTALLAIVILAAGCSATINGTARPAPNGAPRSLSGHTIKRVLLGQSALSRIVKQPVNIDPRFPPSFGGPETLQGNSSGGANDCIGVAVMLQRSVYQDSDVKNVALTTWRTGCQFCSGGNDVDRVGLSQSAYPGRHSSRAGHRWAG